MPGAQKPRMIKTKTGRLINSSFVGKEKINGVIQLKKVEGENTTRQIKKSLKDLNKERLDAILKDAKRAKDPAKYLLAKGIDLRQLNVRGYSAGALKEAGYSARALIEVGFSQKEINPLFKK